MTFIDCGNMLHKYGVVVMVNSFNVIFGQSVFDNRTERNSDQPITFACYRVPFHLVEPHIHISDLRASIQTYIATLDLVVNKGYDDSTTPYIYMLRNVIIVFATTINGDDR